MAELLVECNKKYEEFADLIGKNTANKNGMKEVIKNNIWPVFEKDIKRNTPTGFKGWAFSAFKASLPKEIKEFLGIKNANELIKYLSNREKATSLILHFGHNADYLSDKDIDTISLFLTMQNALK